MDCFNIADRHKEKKLFGKEKSDNSLTYCIITEKMIIRQTCVVRGSI